jgi:hypothetical protein
MKNTTKVALSVAAIGAVTALVAALISKPPSKDSGQLEILEATLTIYGEVSEVAEKKSEPFYIEAKSEWGADDGVQRSGSISAPEGWRITSFTHKAGRTLGKKDPVVTANKNGGKIDYTIKAKHGPWNDRWRHHAWLEIEYNIAGNVIREWKSKKHELTDYLKLAKGGNTQLANLGEYKIPDKLQNITYAINLHIRASQGAVESKVFKFSGSETNQERKILGGRMIMKDNLITIHDENDNLER